MKKADLNKEKRLRAKREKNTLKRKGKKMTPSFFTQTGTSALERKRYEIDQKVIENFGFELDDFLNEQNGSSAAVPPEGPIEIPESFRLEDEPEVVFKKIRQVRQKMMLMNSDEIRIDFTNCISVDFASLFLLRVVVVEYRRALQRLQRRLTTIAVRPRIRIIESNLENVNTKLLANHILSSVDVKESDLMPVSAMKFHEGSKKQSKYSENRKGIVATKIRRYIDDCLLKYSATLSANEQTELDGIISETLNNAEDHSPFDKWYSFGNFFMSTNKSKQTIGEVNLAFMNFGYSIYDGIEETKNFNPRQYEALDDLYKKVSSKDRLGRFSKENMFTLYALQEGISRLKHEDKSRGTGTMTFIRSFQKLGDFQAIKKEHAHRLLLFTGKTMVRCDNKFRPFKKDDRFFISLNEQNDLGALPEKSHLKGLKIKFPGTLLIVKMVLNKEHLHDKIDNGE